MGRGNNFREPRRRGFDDDTYSVRESRGAQSRPFPISGPSAVEGPPTEATVKWFNPEKGFGFVTVNNGASDAFLHVAVLQAAGHQSILPGAKLRAHIGSGAKGAQVTRILEIDESSATAEPPRRDRSPATRGRRDVVDPASAIEIRGAVKWFNGDKGFGFISVDDGEKDAFVHISVLEKAGINGLTEGQQVTARIVQTPKGREVISIALAPFA
jgi:CspA family cold shock protein